MLEEWQACFGADSSPASPLAIIIGPAALGTLGAGASRADVLHLSAVHVCVVTLAPSHGEQAIYFLPTWLSTCLPRATCSPSAHGGMPSRD